MGRLLPALFLLTLGLALSLTARASSGASSPLLGISLPGNVPGDMERLTLERAFKRVASALRFTCDPTALEVYRLEGPLGEEGRRGLERRLREAGWQLSSSAIGATRAWLLEREVFSRRVKVLLVEAQEGGRAFLGSCPSLLP